MTQRKTQTAAYWQEKFTVTDQDIEVILQKILESNRLFSLDEIAIAIVRRHCDEEEKTTRRELQQGKLYIPRENFEVGEKVVFPALDFAPGQVEESRSGYHPQYGELTIIKVAFDNNAAYEFVAEFDQPHALNISSEQGLATMQGLLSPEELYETYQEPISAKVRAALNRSPEFVEFQEQYFLKDLLVDFHEGLFNIADAAIDISRGPLPVEPLIEQMGLAEERELDDILRFSVNYQLDSDERFDDVGPTDQILWYLKRLEPEEAHHPPRRLQTGQQAYDKSLFDEDLLTLLAEIDDELTHPADIPPTDPDTEQITIVLNYPHRRAGTLPLTPKTEPFFPTSEYNPVLINCVDGRTGNTFLGWVVEGYKYVFGLGDWYEENNLPVGAFIHLKKTDDPMRIIVDYKPVRAKRDWVRMASVANKRLNFQMNTEAIGCEYDELMIISEADTNQIDQLWLATEENKTSPYTLLGHIFPELSKLNPQSTVHAKTLYNAVNVIRRVAPGVIFQELVNRRCFIPMNPMNRDYWTYDASLREE